MTISLDAGKSIILRFVTDISLCPKYSKPSYISFSQSRGACGSFICNETKPSKSSQLTPFFNKPI